MANQAVPRLIELVKPTVKCSKNFVPLLMEKLAQQHNTLSIPSTVPRNVAHVGGERSYMLLGSLAKLEQALMRWAMDQLVTKYNYTPVIVPNILHNTIIDRCGFPTESQRSQVYKISATNDESSHATNEKTESRKVTSCLAGTSEFALTAINIGDTIPAEELPKRYCALSRCYRAETSSTSSEWGLYRVHYFNKVEMVSLTMPDKSTDLHEEMLSIQKDLFNQLELHYQVLEMPEHDLGLSASKKYDIEAWMSGRKRFGEISSTSNCRDYQASRLDIKYSSMVEKDNQLQIESGFVHTVNGTACSSIRTLIALFEQHQTEDGKVNLPKVLVPYMNGIKTLPTEADVNLLREVELYPKVDTVNK